MPGWKWRIVTFPLSSSEESLYSSIGSSYHLAFLGSGRAGWLNDRAYKDGIGVFSVGEAFSPPAQIKYSQSAKPFLYPPTPDSNNQSTHTLIFIRNVRNHWCLWKETEILLQLLETARLRRVSSSSSSLPPESSLWSEADTRPGSAWSLTIGYGRDTQLFL